MTKMDYKEEKVVLVGLEINGSDEDIESSMAELEDLAQAAGGQVVFSLVQTRSSADPSTYIGRGKAKEVKALVEELGADSVLFNDELSGTQVRNLVDIIGIKVLDRTNVILDIFAQRASSSEGKLQVKLAQLKYRLPRLAGMGQAMSRTGGGIGTRGPGEQKLETDRRHIQQEIKNIERNLKKVSKNREITRSRRMDKEIPIIALTGYTNSGKSSLMNKIIESTDIEGQDRDVYVEDMVFATLGTSLRRAEFRQGQDFLLIDTVGFISKLPTYLVEAFKSTLEEIRYADLIIHLVDGTSENIDLHIGTTNEILMELGVLDKPMIYAFNKLDQMDKVNMAYLNKYKPSLFISAKTGENVDKLLDLAYEKISENNIRVRLFFDYDNQDSLSYLLEKYSIRDIEYMEAGASITASISKSDYDKYSENVIKSV